MMAPERLVITDGMRFHTVIFRTGDRKLLMPGRYFGIGADTQYQLDQIAVNLRVVNVSTGEILSSVTTSKTILSYEVQAGVFRFIDYQRLLEGEIGYTSNEPVMLCLMSAIETGVIFLINDGIDRGLWDLQNKSDVSNAVLVKYREMSVPPES